MSLQRADILRAEPPGCKPEALPEGSDSPTPEEIGWAEPRHCTEVEGEEDCGYPLGRP